MPPGLRCADGVEDLPLRAMGEEMETNGGCGDGNLMAALLCLQNLLMTEPWLAEKREDGEKGCSSRKEENMYT